MNMNKKKVFTIALAVCLIAILSVSTLAWFNDSDSVENNFHVSDSNQDGKPDFSVDVYEQKVDENGEPVTEGGKPVYINDGNTYNDILPGDQLNKLAKVKNTGDYYQWIRVNITISDASTWLKALAKCGVDTTNNALITDYIVTGLLGGFDKSLYEDTIHLNYNIYGNDTMTVTAYYAGTLGADAWFQVMNKFNIPGALEQEDMNFGTDGFSVKIYAEAVQVDNISAASASEAFNEVRWEIGTEYGA